MKTQKLFCVSILFSALVILSAASAATAQTYGGRSVGATATITNGGSVTNYAFADSGALPLQGGNVTATAPSAFIDAYLLTGVLTASTSGALRSSQSVTVANDVAIYAGSVQIRTNRVTTNSGCICCPGADLPSCVGTTVVNQLTITDAAGATTTVTVTGNANQTVTLPNGAGTLIINEQVVGLASITVNGLRVRGPSAGVTYDIVVASSTTSLECLGTVPTAGEVTVSGRVLAADGSIVSRATVTLLDDAGNARSAATGSTGSFSFADVDPGQTYILRVSHRSYQFSPRTINVTADMSVDLVSN